MSPLPHPRTFALTVALALCAAAWTAGCASGSATLAALTEGANQNQARAHYGEPLAIYELPEGSVWFYDTGVRNLQRERLLFDAQGRLQQQGSAWSRQSFAQAQPGWGSQEVLHHFGPPIRQQAPRASLFQTSTTETFRPSAQPSGATASTSHWIYGFREQGRFYTVTIAVSQGQVNAISVQEETAYNGP